MPSSAPVVPLLHAALGQIAASIHRIGCPAPKPLVATLGIIEPEVAAQSRASRGHALAGVQIHLLVLHTAPQPFHEHCPPIAPCRLLSLPRQAVSRGPLAPLSTSVNAMLVNCAPWSVLKISARPWCARASSRASTQKSLSGVLDSRHASTAAVPVHDRDQVEEPSGPGEGAEVGRPYLIGALHGEVPEQIRVDRAGRPWPGRLVRGRGYSASSPIRPQRSPRPL